MSARIRTKRAAAREDRPGVAEIGINILNLSQVRLGNEGEPATEQLSSSLRGLWRNDI